MDTFLSVDWGDHLHTTGKPYGKQQIDALMKRMAEAGVTGVLWRTDGCGVLYYAGKHARRLDQTVCPIRSQAAETFAECDPMAAAVESAHRYGLKIFSYTTLWDSWRQGFDDDDGHVITDYTDLFFEDHPEYWLASRDGTQFCEGVPCYAIEEVIEHRLAQFRELCSYDVDGFFLCSRSHSRSGWTPIEDHFGYNEPIAAEYIRRFGVDPREQDFCRDAWRRIHGEFITAFYRRIRETTKGRDLWAGISPNNNWLLAQNMYASHPFSCTIHRDWMTWLREDILDGLVLQLSRFEPHDMNELKNYQAVGRALGGTVGVWRNLVRRLDGPKSDASGHEMISAEMLRRRQAEIEQVGFDASIWHEACELEYSGFGEPHVCPGISTERPSNEIPPENWFDRYSAHWDALCS